MQNKYEEEDIVTVKISEQCSVKMVGLSIVGTREYQQDAYYMSSTNVGTLAIICDGIGRHRAWRNSKSKSNRNAGD